MTGDHNNQSSELELTGRHSVAGEWRIGQGKSFCAIEAKMGTALSPTFHEAGAAEVEAAVGAAKAAFQQTRTLPPARRAEMLEAIAASIERHTDALIARAGMESGLLEARLKSELGRTIGQFHLFAGVVREGAWVDAVIDTADSARLPMPKPDLRRMLRPLGPVVVFDASNFPFAYGACGGDTASALAAGCPVIVKSHPAHPGTGEIFAIAVAEALEKTGLPAGLFSLLQGAGIEIGALLTQHPDVEAVGFTGSLGAGRALFDLASARPRPIPVYAEMGSVNPLVILPGALDERLETIVEGLSLSITVGGGQFCTKPGLVFYVGNKVANDAGSKTETSSGNDLDSRFVDSLTAKMMSVPAITLLNASIQKRFAQRVTDITGVDEVETKVTGTFRGNADASPSLMTVDAGVWQRNPTLHEEAFGPGALLIRCRDTAELLSVLESVSGQLTGSLHVGAKDDPETVRAIADVLEQRVGRLVFNGYPTGVEVGRAIIHGGPYPATTAAGTTSVGSAAILRFVRPVAYQNMPDVLLPPALQNANPLHIRRTVNGQQTEAAI